jgi:hypothetical protein
MVDLKRKKEKVTNQKYVRYLYKDGTTTTIEWFEPWDGPWPYGYDAVIKTIKKE